MIYGELFQLVAVVDANEEVVSITKRTVPWSMIIKNNNFVKRLYRETDVRGGLVVGGSASYYFFILQEARQGG